MPLIDELPPSTFPRDYIRLRPCKPASAPVQPVGAWIADAMPIANRYVDPHIIVFAAGANDDVIERCSRLARSDGPLISLIRS
jgi:hypothetical protein